MADQGRIYSSGGEVVDPPSLTLLGSYDAFGPVRPAADRDLVFFLDGPYLRIFDLDGFVWLQDYFVGISSRDEALGRMVRWGRDGLAVRIGDRFASDRVLLLTVSDVPPPDADGDRVADPFDNCPEHANPAQQDGDADGLGDACDRFPDDADNLGACVVGLDEIEALVVRLAEENARLESALADALGRLDSDRDGVPDAADACGGSRRNGAVDAAGCQPWQRRSSSD